MRVLGVDPGLTRCGLGVVDGVECEHLAFRGPDTDWQIWIETGAKPVPRKYVITSKTVAGAPQYTLRIKEWKADLSPDVFVFKPAQGANKLALKDLTDIDEVPQEPWRREERNDPHICNSDESLNRGRRRRCGSDVERTAGLTIVVRIVG